MARRAKNGKDATAYRPIIDWLVRDLKLEHLTIKYRFMHAKHRGGRATQYRDGTCVVEVNADSRHDHILHYLAHELRHIWQFINGMNNDVYDASINGYVKEWRTADTFVRMPLAEEKVLFRQKDNAYQNLPWEKDANDYAARVHKHIKLIPKRS